MRRRFAGFFVFLLLSFHLHGFFHANEAHAHSESRECAVCHIQNHTPVEDADAVEFLFSFYFVALQPKLHAALKPGVRFLITGAPRGPPLTIAA